MSISHFIDVTVKGEVPAEKRFAMNQTISFVHRANGAFNAGLASDFPGLVTGENRTLGDVHRIFGSETEVEKVSVDLGGLVAAGYAVVTKTAPVPTVTRFVNVVRDRTDEMKTPAAKARKDRRALSRLEAGKTRLTGEEIAARSSGEKAEVSSGANPFVIIRSLSTLQNFVIAVDRSETTVRSDGVIGKYGLSSKENPHSVPLF